MIIFFEKLKIKINSFFLRFRFKYNKLEIPVYFDYVGNFKDSFKIAELNTIQAEKSYFDYSPILLKTKDKGQIIVRKVTFRSGCFLSAKEKGKIIIGKNAFFNTNCCVICRDQIKIGDNFMASDNVYIRDNDGHNFNIDGITNKNKSIEIGNNVWLGRNVIVLKGVQIGNNVVIGAGSVVAKDIPCNCIAAGNPAKVIKSGKVTWEKF
jgi:acetyltransferase-like isoleucine patch superfamily enzyme